MRRTEEPINAKHGMPRWVRWIPWVALGGFSTLWLARWPDFPLLLDPYYHLFVARQVAEAGGPIAYEWWEYAPIGRPHLYPPLLHLLLAGLLRLGCSPITTVRLLSVLVPSAVLASVYAVSRRLFGHRVAIATLLSALVPFSWVLQLSHGLAAGLASLELLWLLVSVAEGRWAAAACLIALLCYTHLGFPWVALITMLAAVVMRALPWPRRTLGSVVTGFLLGAPWLLHIAAHAHLLQVVRRAENETFDMVPLLWGVAAMGAWRCWRRGGRARLLPAMWLGFCLMGAVFTFRWLSGEGLLPVILLAGYGVASCAEGLERRWPRRKTGWRSLAMLCALLALSPTAVVQLSPLMTTAAMGETVRGTVASRPAGGRAVSVSPRVAWGWMDATPFHLAGVTTGIPRTQELRLHSRFTDQLAAQITAVSQPGEILWANATYVGGLLATLTGRALSCGMFYEVPPAQPLDPIGAAHVFVWLRMAPLPGTPPLDDLVRRYRLVPVAESKIALVFRNPGAEQLSRKPQAVLPSWAAFMLLCAFMGTIMWDMHRSTDEPQGV